MTIQLTDEQAQVIDRAVQAGLIRDAGEAVELGVGRVRQRLETATHPANALSREEWSKKLHAWANSHSTETPLLSDEAISRESIYGDRGL
jgi:Arc/MetJ-type ribon-helix-helix transcriptional regulator